MDEPTLKVGLLLGRPSARLELEGEYDLVVDGRVQGRISGPREVVAEARTGELSLAGLARGQNIRLIPAGPGPSTFLLRDMIVGVAFHCEHAEDLRFSGGVILTPRGDDLDVVNEVPLEDYLVSVISSEMSPERPSGPQRSSDARFR